MFGSANSIDAAVLELLAEIGEVDPETPIRRNWASAKEAILLSRFERFDLLIEFVGPDATVALAHLNELWTLRMGHNYAVRPGYLAITRTRPDPETVHRIRQLGGEYMLLDEVPGRFKVELEQIRLQMARIRSSLPYFKIQVEGEGHERHAIVFVLASRGSRIRVGGSDRIAATLAVIITNNGQPRTVKAWRNIIAADPLFMPAGGTFEVPSESSLKVYFHREFPKYLQVAFDKVRTGFSAGRVIQKKQLAPKAVGYNILGTRR
jgi:hypothetical protein